MNSFSPWSPPLLNAFLSSTCLVASWASCVLTFNFLCYGWLLTNPLVNLIYITQRNPNSHFNQAAHSYPSYLVEHEAAGRMCKHPRLRLFIMYHLHNQYKVMINNEHSQVWTTIPDPDDNPRCNLKFYIII